MNDEQRHFLSLLAQPPARFTAEQAAWALNCQPHDIPVLVAERLLKPLGNPQANGTKYFSAVEVRELARDRAWLARMTNAIYERWRQGNLRKGNGARRTLIHPNESPRLGRPSAPCPPVATA